MLNTLNMLDHAVAPVRALRPTTVRRVPPAHPEPPYDERGAAGRTAVALPAPVQGTLALSFVPAAPAPVPRRPPLRLVPLPAGEEREPVGLPAVQPWAHRLGQAMVETLTGDRTPDQLAPWTSDGVYQAIAARVAGRPDPRALPAGRALPDRKTVPGGKTPPGGRTLPRRRVRPRVRPRVRSVRVYRPSRWVAEVTVIAHDGVRPRALALRLEARGDRWLCTAAEFGR